MDEAGNGMGLALASERLALTWIQGRLAYTFELVFQTGLVNGLKSAAFGLLTPADHSERFG